MYAERKFAKADAVATLAFVGMKQGKSTDGDAVPPTETALEFAARVEAHHASLSAEYTATQAMRVYLDGLTDQSLADIVRNRAGLAERKGKKFILSLFRNFFISNWKLARFCLVRLTRSRFGSRRMSGLRLSAFQSCFSLSFVNGAKLSLMVTDVMTSTAGRWL